MSAGSPFDESPPASASTPGLHVSVEHHDAAVVVRVAGDVDLTNAAQLQDSIEHALDGQAQVVVVDLTGVDFPARPGWRCSSPPTAATGTMPASVLSPAPAWHIDR